MTQQNLDFGTGAANDGEFLPTAFVKIQENFDELYTRLGGAASAADTFDAIAPTTTQGDLIVRGASENERLPIGASGYHLQSDGIDAAWAAFLAAGAGAVARPWLDKAMEVVSVADYGASPDAFFTVNDTAFAAALDALSASGGTLLIPEAETYNLGTTLAPANFVVIEGKGYGTILDFQNQSSGPGIDITGNFNNQFRNLEVIRTFAEGFYSGDSGSDPSGIGHHFENVVARFCGGAGFGLQDCYNITLIGCDAWDNAVHGFNFPGFNTSVSALNCNAFNNAASGFALDDVVYSTFTACSSDANGGYAYQGTNIGSVVFNGCGAEVCALGAWGFAASTAIGSGKTVPDIYAVTLNGCFTTGNGIGGGTQSSFMECSSANSKVIQVSLIECRDFTSPDGVSILADGVTSITRMGGTFAGTFNLSGSATITDINGGTISSPTIAATSAITLTKAQNAFTSVTVSNSDAGASSSSGLLAINDNNDVFIMGLTSVAAGAVGGFQSSGAGGMKFQPFLGPMSFYTGFDLRYQIEGTNGMPAWFPGSTTPLSLSVNGSFTLTPTSNTNFRISYRGSDGTTRVGNITLS